MYFGRNDDDLDAVYKIRDNKASTAKEHGKSVQQQEKTRRSESGPPQKGA